MWPLSLYNYKLSPIQRKCFDTLSRVVILLSLGQKATYSGLYIAVY